MYEIYADNTLIYDSTIEDYKIGKGSITLEVNKSGSFTFSLYSDHFYYDKFVKLKTVITVYKSHKIIFRGRILNDVTDYHNNKVLTCEGELGFLQDSIIRPFSFQGSPEELFQKFIDEHNSQVDEFKRFKIGTITIKDANNYVNRSNVAYETTLSNLTSSLIDSTLGGYLYITHGENGTDPIPTLNYLADFTKISPQKIEFGSNLKNYTKTVKADEIATAIIPLGAEIENGGETTEKKRLTIADVNDGVDYVYSAAGVALYGWIFKVVEWKDVTFPEHLKVKALASIDDIVKQNITIELTAVDLHLIDPSIESINICEYVQALSAPHNLDIILLCYKQTIDLLKPDNDSFVLGHTYATFTETANKVSPTVTNFVHNNIGNIEKNIYKPGTTLLDGEKLYSGSVPAEALDVLNLFAKNIYMTGSFNCKVNTFIEPGKAEVDLLRNYLAGNAEIDDISLYDFDSDGVLTQRDVMLASRAMSGTTSLSTWSGAKLSEVTLTINLSDPIKAVRIQGVNMWGNTIDNYFGVYSNLLSANSLTAFNGMIEDSAICKPIRSGSFTVSNYTCDTTHGNGAFYSADINVSVSFDISTYLSSDTPQLFFNTNSDEIINVVPLKWDNRGISKIRIYQTSADITEARINYVAIG